MMQTTLFSVSVSDTMHHFCIANAIIILVTKIETFMMNIHVNLRLGFKLGAYIFCSIQSKWVPSHNIASIQEYCVAFTHYLS